jgi:alkylation response protein AidB-like acyl-CoA dehydrogenase
MKITGVESSSADDLEPVVASKDITVRLLADIEELGLLIRPRSAEMESTGRIPPAVIDSLKRIRVFRIFAPRRYGGLELDFPNGLELIQAAARIESSVGWTVMISAGNGLMASRLPRETCDRVYRTGPDTIFAGSLRIEGSAEATEDGWLVNGRWPFGSACQNADWIYGLCFMTKGGHPLLAPSGEPLVRGCFLPSRDWQIRNNWQVAGLKATGSHDIELTDAIVPESHFFDLVDEPKHHVGPLYRVPKPFLPLILASSLLGMAAGALDEIIQLASTPWQPHHAPSLMRHSEYFQAEIGRIGTEFKAAQCYLRVQAATHWSHALDGTMKTEPFFTHAVQTATWTARACTGIADACFALGEGYAVYDSSGLHRRLRDLQVGAQHYLTQKRQYIRVGKLLLTLGESAPI